MDILSKYEEEYPVKATVYARSGKIAEGGPIEQLVQKMMGGVISETRQVKYILVAMALLLFIISAFLFKGSLNTGTSTTPLLSDDEIMRRSGSAVR